jgi:hypothetical protein
MDAESLTPAQAFAEAVRRAGSQHGFQRATGMTQQSVSYRLSKGLNLPGEFVLAAEREYGISRHVLRPDVYGQADPAVPVVLLPAPIGELEQAR